MHINLIVSILVATVLAGCSDPPDKTTANQKASNVSADEIKATDTDQHVALISIPTESRPYISVVTVTPQNFSAMVQAPSHVEFRTKALSAVSAVVAGRLKKINVQVGDRVKVGTPVAILESAEAAKMRADVAEAKAGLQRAEDRMRRQDMMRKSGVGLEMERAEADVQLREARADYQRSQQALRMIGDGTDQGVVLRASEDGVVLQIKSSIGSALAAGETIIEIGEPQSLWIVADVFDNDLPLIEKGAKATLQISALPEPVTGRVVAVSAAMQSDLRRGAVYIEFDNPNLVLKPGMFAKGLIEAAGPHHIVLPTTAVVIRDKKHTMVYVETGDGRFEPRQVLIGQARDGQVPVLDGLKDGEKVVVSGALLLDSSASMLL
ncbi:MULTISPECIES: efflux RND transporter periplasmic adaptor subunit [Methylomonas]|uniref:Efflux transporter periplasmic adaptor subunit n=2 Tax=Methylomonas TaxID=416 RepID=A0A126T395_9GAMM|nr:MULTISPECIES: efflux RND transporter periplasmic adaptor subunit [Methylomonas]AMK76547.1 efflux transporter periplasmic adaptor subunit [Methylomonas denitrificans]OAI08122.1 efflux transporter periplasmic adaptor subunit [Methylomonas methanica]TCV88589.1 cobalt-zinc-cadmium efflux system membrane fusion protein [Methylomonas methanica]